VRCGGLRGLRLRRLVGARHLRTSAEEGERQNDDRGSEGLLHESLHHAWSRARWTTSARSMLFTG
jgi:hypothetical protein